MILDPTFLEDESDSPLISRGFDAFQNERAEEIITRVSGWLDLLPGARDVDVDPATAAEFTNPQMTQIFERDAEGTFPPKGDPEVNARTCARQKQQVDNLKLVCREIQDYHIGLCNAVAFLQLFIGTADLARIVLALHRSPRHSAGYFGLEPVAFVRDARVFQRLLEEHEPSIASHLAKIGVSPDLYMEDWFIGLAVRVLPLMQLLNFWEAYFQYGSEFLYSFGLAFMREFAAELQNEWTLAGVMPIFRMQDPKAPSQFPPLPLEGTTERLSRVYLSALEMIAEDLIGAGRLEAMRAEEADRIAEEFEQGIGGAGGDYQ